MSFNDSKKEKYIRAAREMGLPENVEAMGYVTGPDGQEIIAFSFAADRDIVKDVFIKLAQEDETMLAVAGAVRELALGQAVMGLDLIGPAEIVKLLCDDGDKPADEEFYAMLLMTMAVKNALVSYADYRRINK